MLTRTRTIIACAAAMTAALLATAGASAPAVAATHGAIGPAGIVAGRGWALPPATSHRATSLTSAPANSRTFAGYGTGVPAGSATVLTASFTVPALSCTTVDLAIGPSAAVPANNYKTYSGAYVFTACLNGTATYYPVLVVNGKGTPYPKSPVAAGDVIDLTTKVSTNRTRVQLTDVNTGVTQKIIGPGASASAAFLGDDGWGNSSGALMHVPSFGKLTFKNGILDGKALASWRPQAIQRVNSVGTLQIATGGFWPGGTAFTTHYQHS